MKRPAVNTSSTQVVNLPTAEYLQECFEVRQGELFWKERPEEHFEIPRIWKRFNTLRSGTRAGSPNNKGYNQVTLDGRKYLTGRIMFCITEGNWPVGSLGKSKR